jgi:hypothetical protein
MMDGPTPMEISPPPAARTSESEEKNVLFPVMEEAICSLKMLQVEDEPQRQKMHHAAGYVAVCIVGVVLDSDASYTICKLQHH